MNERIKSEMQERLVAMRTGSEPSDPWPRACRGSRRPWLVFLGPSPGGADGKDENAGPLWNKAFTDPFRWGGGFKQSMEPLLRLLMPEATFEESQYLYAVYNLDSVQNPKASEVPLASMKKGVSGVMLLLEHFPPRLIVAMESRCFRLFTDGLRAQGYEIGDGKSQKVPVHIPIYDSGRFHRSGFAFKIRGTGALHGTVVVKSPQHPARIFHRDYAESCGREVRRLFEQLL